jgi:hypothetical protein
MLEVRSGQVKLPVPRVYEHEREGPDRDTKRAAEGEHGRPSTKEFEALFRDSDPRRRAENIARLNGCELTLDEKSEVARFTRIE